MKIDLALQQKGSKDIRPDEKRVRQYLEGFNIEVFEMVGTLSNQEGMYALVRGAGGVHRVRVGDYLGRNHGRIVKINEASVDVVEIVPDGEGGWEQITKPPKSGDTPVPRAGDSAARQNLGAQQSQWSRTQPSAANQQNFQQLNNEFRARQMGAQRQQSYQMNRPAFRGGGGGAGGRRR